MKFQNNNILYVILLIIFISLLVRIPFMRQNISFNNDAPIYARNIEKQFFDQSYDVHAPGYVSYIYLGRLIYSFVDNTTWVQHIINIILTILIVLFMFKLLIKLNFSLLKSFFLTLIFSFNNILLLGSITGGNRMFLTLTSILLIYISIIIINDQHYHFILYFSIIFAVAIGFRQDISIYFLPLYIYLMFKIKNKKLILYSVVIFTIICLTWFIPLIMEYGGFKGYLFKLKNAEAVYDTSIIVSSDSLSPYLNIIRIFIYLVNSTLIILPIFFYNLFSKKISIPGNLLVILLLSLIPPFIFQATVHNGNYVHLASFITPLFIILTYNFNIIKSKKLIITPVTIILFLMMQFYGIQMFHKPNKIQKLVNVLWLQYSYDGVKSGETLRLRMLEDDFKK